MKIWGKKPLKNYGFRMAESVLSILCHILKGEKIIAEKLEKEKPALEVGSSSSAAGASRFFGGLGPMGPSTSRAAAGREPMSTAAGSGTAAAADSEIFSPPILSFEAFSAAAANQAAIGGASGSGSAAASGSGSAAAAAPPAAAAGASGGPAEPPQEPSVNQEHLQTLLDMGFSHERCLDAIQNTNTLDQATDYLLIHPRPLGNTSRSVVPPVPEMADNLQVIRGIAPSLGGGGQPAGEQDELMRAIAMSLGENVSVSTSEPAENSEAKKEEQEEDDRLEKEDFAPLSKSVIDEFTSKALSGCLSLLDTLPDTVYRVCDLLLAVFHRNGIGFKEEVLRGLIEVIYSDCQRKISPPPKKKKKSFMTVISPLFAGGAQVRCWTKIRHRISRLGPRAHF